MIQIKLGIDARSRERFKQRLTFISQGIPRGIRRSLARSGIIMLRSINRNFEVQGRPTMWQPLSPATISMRRKGGVGAKILQDTGKLKNSITMQLSEDSVKVGTNVKYAPYLQFGVRRTRGMIRGKTIPPRPFVLFQEEDKERILTVFNENLRRLIQLQEPE